jgi:viroplasmin and RNaseH domain-containing protein
MKNQAYVVFEGFNPGVYKTWPECNREITKYKV